MQLLEQHGVIVDQNKRKSIILSDLQNISSKLGCKIIENNQLLDEWVCSIEHPSVFFSAIDEEFMSLPRELIIITLVEHQKYMLLENQDGALAPYFIGLADFPREKLTEEINQNIISGNEKVLRARLSDAKFHYETDLQQRLDARIDALKDFGFPVGNLFDKVQRVSDLSMNIADQIELNAQDKKDIARACLLCKADLSSGVVNEFPEMQGIIGSYYALRDGENKEVSLAIKEHYMPTQAEAPLPTSLYGSIIALADRLDTLTQLFSINIKPTGSKDPYALRRAAIAVGRILEMDNMKKVNLTLLSISDEVMNFIKERKR